MRVTLLWDFVEAQPTIPCVVDTVTRKQLQVARDPVEVRFPTASNGLRNSSAVYKYCLREARDLLAILLPDHRSAGPRDVVSSDVKDSPKDECC